MKGWLCFLWLMFIVSVCALVALAQEQPPPATQPAEEEPPLRFVLEIAGQSVPIEADQTFDIEIDGRTVRGRLVPQPTRQFNAGGVSFEFPRQHAFEVDREDPDVTIWTLDGNSSVIMLMHFDEQIEAEDLVEMLTAQFGSKNVSREASELRLAGEARSGTRLIIRVAGVRLHQDVFVFPSGQDATLALIVQDSPNDDGTTSDETRAVMELLERTFRFSGKR